MKKDNESHYETCAWKKGSMMFIVKETDSTFDEKFVSKKNEPPSAFIARVLKRSMSINGAAAFSYLKNDMKDYI